LDLPLLASMTGHEGSSLGLVDVVGVLPVELGLGKVVSRGRSLRGGNEVELGLLVRLPLGRSHHADLPLLSAMTGNKSSSIGLVDSLLMLPVELGLGEIVFGSGSNGRGNERKLGVLVRLPLRRSNHLDLPLLASMTGHEGSSLGLVDVVGVLPVELGLGKVVSRGRSLRGGNEVELGLLVRLPLGRSHYTDLPLLASMTGNKGVFPAAVIAGVPGLLPALPVVGGKVLLPVGVSSGDKGRLPVSLPLAATGDKVEGLLLVDELGLLPV